MLVLKVSVDRHDGAGVKTNVTGPRLNAEIVAWSVMVVVTVELVAAISNARKEYMPYNVGTAFERHRGCYVY